MENGCVTSAMNDGGKQEDSRRNNIHANGLNGANNNKLDISYKSTRKLVLHFDIRNTILVADSVTNIYVYIYIYIYIYIYMCVCIVYIYMCVCVCVRACVRACLRVCVLSRRVVLFVKPPKIHLCWVMIDHDASAPTQVVLFIMHRQPFGPLPDSRVFSPTFNTVV